MEIAINQGEEMLEEEDLPAPSNKGRLGSIIGFGGGLKAGGKRVSIQNIPEAPAKKKPNLTSITEVPN